MIFESLKLASKDLRFIYLTAHLFSLKCFIIDLLLRLYCGINFCYRIAQRSPIYLPSAGDILDHSVWANWVADISVLAYCNIRLIWTFWLRKISRPEIINQKLQKGAWFPTHLPSNSEVHNCNLYNN